MNSIQAKLDSRAKYKVGDVVTGPGFSLMRVIARYWRRTEDAFYYDLEELPVKGTRPQKKRKVPEDHILRKG